MDRFLTRRIWVAFSVVAVVGWLFAWGAARLLVVHSPIRDAEAILILSGSSAIQERTHLAAQLYKEGRAPRIILTNDNQQLGWLSQEQRNLFSYEWATRELRGAGVPADRIEVLRQPVMGTDEELSLVRDYADRHRLNSLMIVTSAYHSRRAWWTIRHVFKDSKLVIGLEHGNPTPSPWSWWLHRSGWRMVAGEYLKMAYYWLRFQSLALGAEITSS